uniref:Variant surface glycoprotein 1125.5121 n=1 Tax=Trypanosoma brucei TaxID=5691 RepID=A0A1J0RBT5_9TRYP|nr:variant surface glycoprotein 1125.5121 [Trypanosoma brucei]
MRGRIAELLGFFQAAAGGAGNSGFCLATNAGANGYTEFSATSCGNKDPNLQASTTKLAETEQAATGFPGTKLDSAAIEAGGSGATSCFVTATGSNAAAQVFQQDQSADFLGGLWSFKANTGTPQMSINKNTAIASAWRAQGSNEIAQTYNAIRETNAAQSAADFSSAGDVVTKLGNKEQLQPHLIKQLIVDNATVSTETAPAIAADVYKEVFGSDSDKLTKLWNDIQKQTVKGSEDKGDIAKPLSGIDSEEKLLQVLSYYASTRMQQVQKLEKDLLQTKDNVKIVTKTPEQICADLKGPEKCGTNDNCKYDKEKSDEPKCVLSDKGKQAAEKANQETEGKTGTTNTTGSNCFVIHKAPLLFAFCFYYKIEEFFLIL